MNQTADRIYETMEDLVQYDDDLYWITYTETMFERLTELFLLAGGNQELLSDTWPEYF